MFDGLSGTEAPFDGLSETEAALDRSPWIGAPVTFTTLDDRPSHASELF
ncbi:hypothetical protein [Actinoallomurus sp. CA-150999]